MPVEAARIDGLGRQDEGPPTRAPGAAPIDLPRVLVVDDEAPLVRLVATYLDRAGFEIETVGTRSPAPGRGIPQ